MFQERLTAVLPVNLIQKCGVQNYDYQEFLRVLEYNTQQVINNTPTCNDTTVGLFLKNKFNIETASPQELEEKQKASLSPINAIVKKFQKGYQKQKI